MCAGKTFSRHLELGSLRFAGAFFYGWREGRGYPATRRALCGLMRSSSGEDGLLAEWLSDVVVIPTPKTIHGNAAGGDWNGVWREPTPEKGKGVLSMAVCVGKGCGRRSGKHGRLWKRRGMESRVGGFGEGDTTLQKRSPSPMLLTPSKPLCSGMCRYAIRPAPASSKEARFRLMAETRIRHETARFAPHIAGAGDLFKAAGRIVQHAQIAGLGPRTSEHGRRLGRPSARRPIVRPGWRAPKLHPVP